MNDCVYKPILVLLAAMAIVLTGTGMSGQAADLDRVLQKHLDALGNADSVRAISSIAAYLDITYMSLPARGVMLFEFPDRYYDRFETPSGTYESGFDGGIGWMTDANGYTRQLSDEELRSTINELYLNSYSYVLPGNLPGSTVYVGDTAFDGAVYHHVKIYPARGDSLSLLIDSVNGRLDYSIADMDGIPMITAYRDFRTVSGISIPFTSVTHSPEGPYEMSTQLDSVVFNGDIPDSIFAMPGKRIDYEFDTDIDSTVIPLRKTRYGLSVQVTVNGGGPFRFLLDTGSSMTLLSERLADELGIDVKGTFPSRGIGGFDAIAPGNIDSVRIGKLLWRLTHVSIFDLAKTGISGLQEIDGILGYDFFVRFPMRLDFVRQELVIYNQASARAFSGQAVPITIFRGIPLVEGVLDGVPTRLGLDLGAASTLIMRRDSRWFMEKGVRLVESGRPTSLQGMGGTVSAVSVPVELLRLGEVSFDVSRAVLSTDETAERYSEHIEGLIGMEAFGEYVLLLDYGKRRIYFVKGTGTNK